jgi:hypothetical protein
MMGCSTVMALLICSFALVFVLPFEGLTVTTESQTLAASSSSVNDDDNYFLPPTGMMVFSSNAKSNQFS